MMRSVIGGLLALAATCSFAETCPQLAMEGEQTGRFTSDGSACFRLPAVSENAVSATLDGVVNAALVDSSRRWFRTLLKDGPADGHQSLLFAIPDRETVTLRLYGLPKSKWTLRWRIVETVPLSLDRTEEPESPVLNQLASDIAAGKTTDEFWQRMAASGTPLVEPLNDGRKRVTFLWRGAHDNAFILGSPNGEHDPLYRLANSDVWFRSFAVPADTLMQYKLAPNVPEMSGDVYLQHRAILINAQVDPLNPNTFSAEPLDRWNQQSLLALSPQRFCSVAAMQRPLSEGTLIKQRLYSRQLKNTRSVQLYRPKDTTAAWTLMLFDGNIYQNSYKIANIVDALIHNGTLPPLNLVLIDSLDHVRRSKELPPNPQFANFMAKEVMPWLKAAGVSTTPAHTVVAGSSYGGIAAAWLALRYPQLFPNVISLSGSYWWAPANEAPGWLTRQYQLAPHQPVRLWLQAGRFEKRGPGGGNFKATLDFGQALKAKGYDVTFHPYSGGHDYASWCEALVDGLSAFTTQ